MSFKKYFKKRKKVWFVLICLIFITSLFLIGCTKIDCEKKCINLEYNSGYCKNATFGTPTTSFCDEGEIYILSEGTSCHIPVEISNKGETACCCIIK